MGDKVGENPAALRAPVFLLTAKNRRGGGVQTPPPSRAKVNRVVTRRGRLPAPERQRPGIVWAGGLTLMREYRHVT